MTIRLGVAAVLMAAFLFPPNAGAHVLPDDPQTLEEQLGSCDLDLFRTQRGDGTYYAALGNQVLAEQFYPLIFRQSFRRRNPFRPARDEGLARRLAPQMVDMTLNLAYADALPSRSRRSARLRALISANLSVVDPHVLRAVIGPETGRARRAMRQTGIAPEILGATVLAVTMVDLYDKVAWGPSFVVDHKLPQMFDSSGWSLDGAVLSEAQFDLLVQEAQTYFQGLGRKAKIDFVGGPCLHTHPLVLSVVVEEAQFWDWLRRLLGGGDSGGGGGGGGGSMPTFEGAIDVVDRDPRRDPPPPPEPPPLEDPTRRGTPPEGGGDPGHDPGGIGGGRGGGGGEPDQNRSCLPEWVWETNPQIPDCDQLDPSDRCLERIEHCYGTLTNSQRACAAAVAASKQGRGGRLRKPFVRAICKVLLLGTDQTCVERAIYDPLLSCG